MEKNLAKVYVEMCGLSFFVRHYEDIKNNYEFLKQNSAKEEYTKKIILEEPKLVYSGAIMKLNGVIKIIEMRAEKEVLEMAIKSNRMNEITKKNAKRILSKLQNE